MVKREYDWRNGASIEPHSKVKLEIVQEYIQEYVRVRCSLPQQERFRLSFVDGFCGAGEYNCGTLGSPLVVLQALQEVSAEINFRRKVDGFKPITFEYFLYFNDISGYAIQGLRSKVDSFLAKDDG
ncbi:MAG: three-Cys-motif partner protein TcmP, partial [Pseudomonadota bacterium]